MAYFIWNGTNSTTKKVGVKVLPPRFKPAERVELITVPGRNGYITQSEGVYESMTITVECWLKQDADIYDVINWLKGSGALIFSDDTNKMYEATIVNAIPFERVLKQWREFVIQFELQPFCKGITLQSTTITSPTLTGSKTVGGNINTEPIITLTGTGNFIITINGKAISLINVVGSIVIDSALYNCTESNGTINANNKMSGEFPVLVPGNNTISIAIDSGAFTTLKLEYYDKWL